jgi:hypothetical protein
MQENLRTKHMRTQCQTGYFHVVVTTKHKDVNAMLGSNSTYYASEITHTMQTHHKNPTTHSQYNSLNNSHTAMIDTPLIKAKKK